LTVPVHYRQVDQKIDEVAIDSSQNWVRRHIDQLHANYRTTPFFSDYIDGYKAIASADHLSISALNVALCRWVMDLLNIQTPVQMSRELRLNGKKSERLIDLLQKVGGTTYLSGPGAAAYIDLDLFRRNGIRVEYKSYEYPAYSQTRPGFCAAVSVLDLLFNTGPMARKYLKSITPDLRAA
jgi:hypothetical protein